jgi:hypothetical protein
MAPDKRDVRVAARIASAQRKAENARIARELDNGRSAMDIEISR